MSACVCVLSGFQWSPSRSGRFGRSSLVSTRLTLSRLARNVMISRGTVLKKHTKARASFPVNARPDRAFGSSWRLRHIYLSQRECSYVEMKRSAYVRCSEIEAPVDQLSSSTTSMRTELLTHSLDTDSRHRVSTVFTSLYDLLGSLGASNSDEGCYQLMLQHRT
jgi:hypothetical protein